MKLTLTMNGFTHSSESEGDDHNVEEMVYQMRSLLVSAGYHPHSVDQYFQEGEFVWDLDTKYEIGRVKIDDGSKASESLGKFTEDLGLDATDEEDMFS